MPHAEAFHNSRVPTSSRGFAVPNSRPFCVGRNICGAHGGTGNRSDGLNVSPRTCTAFAEWLRSCGVKTVAMQSTGVYWIPLYDILEEFGFEIFLVNARHTKNLPGRKSDVQESQWLLKLHTHGLLNNSFQPPSDIRVLRTYWRLRAEHATGMATCIQRMQKALTQMNIQLANVISDLSGWTGQRIVRAILGGERDPEHSPPCAIPAFTRHRRRSPRASQAPGSQTLLFVLQQEVAHV